MIDRIFAPLALLLLACFMGIVIYFVPRWDLAIITAACLGLAVYDVYRTLRSEDPDERG